MTAAAPTHHAPRFDARWLVEVLALAALYFLTARLGLLLAIPGGHVTPVWPPSGIALAAVFLRGRRVWPGIWLGSFAANFWDFHGSPMSLATELGTSATFGIGASLAAVLGSQLLRRFVNGRNPLEQVRDVCAFMALGGVVSCLGSATVGVTTLCLAGYAPWSGYGQTWLTWWLGDTAGVFVVAPLWFVWKGARLPKTAARWVELGACFGLLIAVTYYVFIENTTVLFTGKPLTFFLIPFLVWPALRFGQRGAATAAGLIALLAVWGTIHNTGPFNVGSRNEALLLLELFLSVVVLTALCMAAMATEREHAEAAQRRAVEELETRVQERTAALVQSEAQARKNLAEAERARAALLSIMEDERAAEAALRESEARYRTLFEHAPDGIVIADPESCYLDANASICRMLGYSREELIGRHASEIVAPAEIPFIGPALNAIKAASDYHREWQFRRKDGSVFRAEVIATLMPDGNLLGMIRDISERKRTEARFRRLVDSNAEGVMFWNLKGEITGANDAFLRIVGHSREDLAAGRLAWAAMTPPEYADLDRRGLEEIAARGVCAPYEKEYLRKDGTRVPVLVGAAAFEDNAEEGFSFVLDLTERKKLEQQFLRAQRMESIGTLAGGIAHDLNNVLSPIMMSLELLKMKFTDPGSQELLAIISTSAHRGAEMVSQVLTFARGVEGRRLEVQVRYLIQDLEKLINETFLKHIQVRTRIAHDLWMVLADPTQLHQVLLNLCVNARDAMPQGGTLTLSAGNVTLDAHDAALNLEARPGPYVFLEVEDSGTGIPPEVIEKIFDPFFTTKEVGKGSGLGLSTSLAIVKSHGGFLRVDSEPGRGTRFKVYLPAQTAASPAAAAALAAETPRGHGELILVVDDEASVRQITQQTLLAFGYRVLLACDGSEAVSVFAQQKEEIAAVLTDMMMPVMDGPAAIQVLQRLDPRMPIIAASGLSADAHVARAASLGVKHFLPKPYTTETLLKLLRKVLSEEP